MKCTSCGANLENARNFCPECGAKIEKKNFCTECGVELKIGQKFCSECGTKVNLGQSFVDTSNSVKKSTEQPDSNVIFIDYDEIEEMTDADDSIDGEIYQKAMDGDPVAMFALNHNIWSRITELSVKVGIENVYDNPEYIDLKEKSKFWYEKAANLGVVDAQNSLIQTYNDEDNIRAFYWYKKAKKNKYEEYKKFEYIPLYQVKICKETLEEAIELAETTKDALLYASIGSYYQYDDETNPDYKPYTEDALFWYTKAAELGNQEGIDYLKEVEDWKQKGY